MDTMEEHAAVDRAYANQVAYCRANGAPQTARIVAAIGRLAEAPGDSAFLSRIAGWPGAALADAVPLRSAAGLHALHLSGREPGLAAIYAGEEADDLAVVASVIARHDADLLPWLDSPPQTNEAGRSSGFVAGLLWLAGRGLPPRFDLLEIGSSAGINLMLDRYAYEHGGVKVGPDAPAMAFAPEWRGPPPPDRAIAFAALRGCDVAPVDLTDPEQALRLKAYIWPEHAARFPRLDAAIAAAGQRKPALVAMEAADFVEAELARPQAAGTTRVLVHSIVWQYLPAESQRRIEAAMAAAGERSTPDRALAWVSLEADRTLLGHVLGVRRWPGGGEPVVLGTAHAHGAWIDWRGGVEA